MRAAAFILKDEFEILGRKTRKDEKIQFSDSDDDDDDDDEKEETASDDENGNEDDIDVDDAILDEDD